MSKLEDPLEKQRIRERLGAMHAGKKDADDKQRGRGPMVSSDISKNEVNFEFLKRHELYLVQQKTE